MTTLGPLTHFVIRSNYMDVGDHLDDFWPEFEGSRKQLIATALELMATAYNIGERMSVKDAVYIAIRAEGSSKWAKFIEDFFANPLNSEI